MNAQASKDTAATTTIVKPPYMQNRELSWLDFNKRVLDQGADPTVPLLERLNFISIFWSNLQEFFMVRVGSLTDLSLLKKSIIDPKSGMTPAQQLDAIYARCHELYPYYEETYENGPQRSSPNKAFAVCTRKTSRPSSAITCAATWRTTCCPFLSPQIINARHPFPHLENGGLYIVVRLDEEARSQGEEVEGGARPRQGRGEGHEEPRRRGRDAGHHSAAAPDEPCHRAARRRGLQFILVERAIEMFAAEVFSMYTVKHTNIICVTRNADLDATEGAEEQGEDYREHMKRILKKRSRLAPVRLESERPLSRTVKGLLLEKLGLAEHQLFVTRVPLNMGYTWGLGSRLSAEARAALTQAPFTPQWPACLDRKRSIIEQVSEHEVLLSYPYQSMDAFVQLLREASVDPAVVSIKITLYRLASQSHLAEALINAAENGKEVTALFELRARFDESNNIEWSQRFEAAGCHVIYGFRNFKVHSKICTITRQTENGLQHITQLGTGNYNEKTAKLYTDFSFITCDSQIGHDAADFFRNMALENTSDNYDILWVAPLMIKQNILRNIDVQIERARRGEKCGLFFKTNSITDKEVIDKLVEASQAGVPIDLFVRGISCILPGVEGYTDRVREVSIVGQLLEHSRIYGFGPRDDCKLYLSSADLMTRNMDKRIEIAWPILNDTLRNQVLGYLGICYSDTAKRRELLPDGSYTALGAFAERDENGEVELFDSQKYLIAEAQRMKLVSAELAARQEANNGGSARMVFPLGEVATAGSAPAGADEVVTEEESEFIAHRSPELEAAEAKAVRDAADAMAAAATATAASVLEAVTKGVAQEVAALQAREAQGATAPSEDAPAAGSDPVATDPAEAADPAATAPTAEGPVAERAELDAAAATAVEEGRPRPDTAPTAAAVTAPVPAPAPATEVIDAARTDDGRAIVPAAVVEPAPEGNAIARFFRRLFGK